MARQKIIDKELCDACMNRDLSKVQILLLCGADPCHKFKRKNCTALHWAAVHKDDCTDILEEIISSGKMKDIDAKMVNMKTPLLLACETGTVKCAKLLVENGADVTAKDEFGDGVIIWATVSDNPVMVKECLKWNGVNVNEGGLKNTTALMWACSLHYVDAVRVLLSADADLNPIDDFGNSAPWNARNDKEISQLLVEHSKRKQTHGASSSDLPTALGSLSLSNVSVKNQNISSFNSTIQKVFPDFNERKMTSIREAMENTGIDFNKGNQQQLILCLEPSDFDGVLKPIEARLLIKTFKSSEIGKPVEEQTVVNF